MYLNCSYLWNSLYFHSSLATLLLKSYAKQNYWEHKIIMFDYTLDLGNALLSKRKAMGQNRKDCNARGDRVTVTTAA